VNTSLGWDFGADNEFSNTRPYSYGSGKGDGFNLDVVDITLEKALDESEWAAGYKAEMWFGPDARAIGSQVAGAPDGDVAVKQAYVALRTPIGNGIDWKIGVFDTIVGYEASNAGDNPNYTRSWGYSIEPTQHTGILASYRFGESITTSFGVANTMDAPINARTPDSESKTYMASIAWAFSESLGFLHGGSLYAGIVGGELSTAPAVAGRTHLYFGATVPTPLEGLKAGAALDILDIDDRAGTSDSTTTTLALYASWATTEKLTLHARGDWMKVGGNGAAGTAGIIAPFTSGDEVCTLTVTADYQLWQNVISRAELRWDHSFDDNGANGNNDFRSGNAQDEYSLIANFIYKF
jgi:hypothetical protein